MFPRFESPRAASLDAIQAALVQSGGCLIKDFPLHNDDAIVEQVLAWGEPLHESRNAVQSILYTVQVDETDTLPAYADTPYYFSCHTDCAEFAEPPDTVLLLCDTPADQGGASLWAPIDAVVAHLSAETLLELQKPAFPFKSSFYPILELGTADEITVRYQPIALVLSESAGLWQSTPAQNAAIHAFEEALQRETQRFTLEKGDCWLLNNRRILHGREAFVGPRVLRRARFYLKA